MPLLQKDETLTASTEVRASAEQVYAVVSDVTRIPEWSPETVRAQWLAPDRFRAWNRRRLGRWRTEAIVVEAVAGQRFSFVVQAMGGDWTQWTYLVEPGSTASTSRLTEVVRMCVPLPWGAVVFDVSSCSFGIAVRIFKRTLNFRWTGSARSSRQGIHEVSRAHRCRHGRRLRHRPRTDARPHAGRGACRGRRHRR
ncbi:SRPBCC family protein [Mycobacterium intracellulare]|uniref:SRPBCC family protein n=1 Tax=Mycobacterium intracellulare TaxID=1767 RepID=UPI001E2BAF2F|nr:SRPBCC family protein [Mycobacterium intracellulare]